MSFHEAWSGSARGSRSFFILSTRGFENFQNPSAFFLIDRLTDELAMSSCKVHGDHANF
jgi:hypothetical protein